MQVDSKGAMSSYEGNPEGFFAPSNRLSREDVARQVSELDDSGLLTPIFESMPYMVMILNRQRQIIYGNKVLREYGASHGHSDFLGLRPGEFLGCQRESRAPFGCGTGEACRNCGAVNAILAGLSGQDACLECHIGQVENEALDLRIFASPFRWRTHEHVLVIATDISDQKRRQILERIFFHDILNTAGGIQGLAELMVSDAEMSSELSPDLLSNAQKLVQEIQNQKLLLAAENHDLDCTLTPLSSLVQMESVATSYRHHEVGHAKSVVIDSDSKNCTLLSDEAILQRVLGNLLKNALEATDDGGKVKLGTETKEGDVIFWCWNAGHIPRSSQLQIFQRSFTTKGIGHGLGTYSVKLLTERYLGGRVSFKSSQELGTQFEIRLPLDRPAPKRHDT